MRCPACSRSTTGVLDSRTNANRTVIRRRRSCPFCHHRFTTYEAERPNLTEPTASKNDPRQLTIFDAIKPT